MTGNEDLSDFQRRAEEIVRAIARERAVSLNERSIHKGPSSLAPFEVALYLRSGNVELDIYDGEAVIYGTSGDGKKIDYRMEKHDFPSADVLLARLEEKLRKLF